ncbi:hypothetical protein CR513_46225, partial [Mucuna pruriens]
MAEDKFITLGPNELPNLSEETRRSIMLDKGNSNTRSAMVNQTTSDKENVVEHPSTLPLDQDIQTFSKEEMDRLQVLLNSTSKPLGSFDLTMKVSKKQLINVANGDHVPIVGSSNELTMGRTIGVVKEQGGELSRGRVCHRVITFSYSRCSRSHETTLVPEKVQISKLDVSILDNSIDEQDQLSESEVSIPDNSIENVIDDMTIALRKRKQSCVKYPLSQFVCIDHLSVQHQSFIVVIDAIKIPTSIQEALKDENYV